MATQTDQPRSREPPEKLYFRVTTQPYSRLVDVFCREYKQSFVRAAERESRSGLRLCLAMNGAPGNALHARLGPSREFIVLLRSADGVVAAGINFICFPMDQFGSMMTVHTTYVFVAVAWRGRGLLRSIYQKVEEISRDYGRQCGMPSGTAVIFVGEQRDPFRMTLAGFRADADASGQNAFDRLAMWGRLGARVLLFPYVQPSILPGSPPDPNLFLRILRREDTRDSALPPGRPLDPRVLKEHLQRFFGITVAKGRYDPDGLADVRDQMDDLTRRLALGQAISTQAMPSDAQLTQWKAATLQMLAANTGPSDATIGSLLGVDGMTDPRCASTRLP